MISDRHRSLKGKVLRLAFLLLRILQIPLRLPLFGLGGGDALDALLCMDRFFTAVVVQEILASLGDVEGFLIACGVSESAHGMLGDEGGPIGVVLDLANDLLHVLLFLYAVF